MVNYDNSLFLTVQNDGNGSQCGYTYEQRKSVIKYPRHKLETFKVMAQTANAWHVKNGYEAFTETEVNDAAETLLTYYADHVEKEGATAILSRKGYMDGFFTFEEFYGQFVLPSHRDNVVRRIGEDKLLRSIKSDDTKGDINHMHDIPCATHWDYIGGMISGATFRRACEPFSSPSLSDHVCHAKEAARQWLKQVNPNGSAWLRKYGLYFRCQVFLTVDAANAFCERFTNWGVIEENEGKIYVAHVKDKGQKTKAGTFEAIERL